MRIVRLNLVNYSCPGTLCTTGTSGRMGCAMGEVLFQAGYRISQIAGLVTTDELLNNEELDGGAKLLKYLGLADHPPDRYTNIEEAYDILAGDVNKHDMPEDRIEFLKSERGQELITTLKEEGKKVNIRFMLTADRKTFQKTKKRAKKVVEAPAELQLSDREKQELQELNEELLKNTKLRRPTAFAAPVKETVPA